VGILKNLNMEMGVRVGGGGEEGVGRKE